MMQGSNLKKMLPKNKIKVAVFLFDSLFKERSIMNWVWLKFAQKKLPSSYYQESLYPQTQAWSTCSGKTVGKVFGQTTTFSFVLNCLQNRIWSQALRMICFFARLLLLRARNLLYWVSISAVVAVWLTWRTAYGLNLPEGSVQVAKANTLIMSMIPIFIKAAYLLQTQIDVIYWGSSIIDNIFQCQNQHKIEIQQKTIVKKELTYFIVLICQYYILLNYMSSQSKIVSPETVEKQVQQLFHKNKQLQTKAVKGYDFNKGVNYEELFKSYATTGFQATHLQKAIQIVNSMISWRLSDEPLNQRDDEETSDPAYRAKTRCTIFLGYTSNMTSCGVRDIVRYLAQHRMIDCIVTTAGGIEQDLMKCMGTFHMGEFNMNDIENRLNGHCRIGNILVANESYIKLEEFLLPLFKKMYNEQVKEGITWTPRKVIDRFGKQINNEESIYYWCHKNRIPVFCPALTDGGIGDVLFTNSFKNDLVIDLIGDTKEICKLAMKAPKSGAIVLGGGIPKHHILNSNIWRNGLDYAVYMNTGLYEDGSDSGAKASEGYTWAKLRLDAKYVKIFVEATLTFPILVAETFAKRQSEATKVDMVPAILAKQKEDAKYNKK